MDIAIGIYPQKRDCNTFIKAYIKLELPILNDRAILEFYGGRYHYGAWAHGLSPVVGQLSGLHFTSYPAVLVCVLFGLFNYLLIYRSGLRSTYLANKYGCSFFSLLKVPSLFCFYIFSISFIL